MKQAHREAQEPRKMGRGWMETIHFSVGVGTIKRCHVVGKITQKNQKRKVAKPRCCPQNCILLEWAGWGDRPDLRPQASINDCGWDVIPGQISIISAVPTSSIKIRVDKKEFHQMLEIFFFEIWKNLHCLKLTAKAPEIGWFGRRSFPFKRALFSGANC